MCVIVSAEFRLEEHMPREPVPWFESVRFWLLATVALGFVAVVIAAVSFIGWP